MTGDRIFSRVSTWCHSQKLSNYAKWESPHRLDTYRETFTEHDAYPRTCADWNRVQISAKDVSTFRRVPGGRTRDDANFDFASENMCEFVDSVCGVFSSEDARSRAGRRTRTFVLCRLRHTRLIDAAHAPSDSGGGEPVVTTLSKR